MNTSITFPVRFARTVLTAWCAALCLGALDAPAGETDQYLTWKVTLSDSAGALNAYLDEEIHAFVDKMNHRSRPTEDADELTIKLYQHLFAGLHASRVRNWLKNTDRVERYPADSLSDWEYQRMSIFRYPAFPYKLPMAQTFRLGEVYLGIDKIGHLFGFGRRYFQIYHRCRARGDTHDEAIERVLVWGIHHESNCVGRLVDGIFSHADMEANYQGLRLALAFSSGEGALFYRENDAWRYRGGLDILDYVTPDMDESYNTNDYASWRGRRVMPIVESLYGAAAPPARFALYRHDYQPSLSKVFVDAWFEKRKEAPRDAVASR